MEAIKKGITSTIVIKGGIVTKTIAYKSYNKELLDREVYWLEKLDKYNITPKLIKKTDISITMSYCGENATMQDFKRQDIQLQLIKILKILFENHCFYNDFKLNNFTIKDGKLFIIDFGWCPMIKEDYTCGGRIESNLKTKPCGTIFNLFNIFDDEK
jgi:tRNA A-37 threonylcarbamoyl transferase component Bud32